MSQRRFLLSLSAAAILAPCGIAPSVAEAQEHVSSAENSSANAVELAALDYAFAMPLEIPSGWVTFRMENMGAEEHIALVQEVDDSLDLEAVQELIRNEDWGGLWRGWVAGPGMLSPGRTGQTTVYLEPGVHLMWCTIRTPDGESHADKGMVLAFEVMDQAGQTEKPETDIQITLSNYAMGTDRPIPPGTQRFDVQFADPGSKDVFVARLEEGQTLEHVVEWMEDFRAPSPFVFLGGTEQRPGMFQVTLEPGRYALVSHQGMHAGLAEEIMIPADGAAPVIANEPVNPPVIVTVPNGDPVIKSRPGRTLVTFENRGNSANRFFLDRLKSNFTEAQFHEFVQPAGLGRRWSESDPEAIPSEIVTVVNLRPGERKQYNLELLEGTYFLLPNRREHMAGARGLSSSEMESIKKIEVR